MQRGARPSGPSRSRRPRRRCRRTARRRPCRSGPLASSQASASSTGLPTQSLSSTGLGPLLTTRSTGVSGRSVVPAFGRAADDLADRDGVGPLLGGGAEAEVRLGERVLGLVLGHPLELRYVVALLAEGERDRHRAAVEHLAAGAGVGRDDPADRDGLGVGLVAPLDVEAGVLDLGAARPPWSCRARPASRCSGRRGTTTRRRRGRRAAAPRGSSDQAAAPAPAARAAAASVSVTPGERSSSSSVVRSETASPARGAWRSRGSRTGRTPCRPSRRRAALCADLPQVRHQRRQVRGQVRVVGARPRRARGRPGAPGAAARPRPRDGCSGRGPWRGRPARRRTPGGRARASRAAARPRGRACRRPGSATRRRAASRRSAARRAPRRRRTRRRARRRGRRRPARARGRRRCRSARRRWRCAGCRR